MRRLFLLPVLLVGCASSGPEIRRLNPVAVESKPPAECVLVSVAPGSSAEKAGLRVGDKLLKMNGKAPADAWDAGELVNASPETLQLEVGSSSYTARTLQVPLQKNRPRLGAGCDLSGFRKHGVTAAGNESQTVFQGPYSLTASGIADKGIVFLRLRLTNNSLKEFQLKPDLFTIQDASQRPQVLLTPKEVICDMFGDRGARQLSLKRNKVEGVDFESYAASREEVCGNVPVMGNLKNADSSFVESNAEYLARESLWPAPLKPGATADGVIYLRETGIAMPVTIRITIEGHTLEVGLGSRMVVADPIPEKDLEKFFMAQKKKAPLRITLKKDNKVFVGRFSSYDADEEMVWFNTPAGGLLNSTSIPLRNILSAQSVESN